MRAAGYILMAVTGGLLAGCAGDPVAPPKPPVTIKVVSSDFCQTLRRIYGADGPTWDVADTEESSTSIRRLSAAYQKRCVSSPKPKPTVPTA